MQWLRLFDDLIDNPKIQRLSPPLFKILINVWCLASKNDPRGVLPDDEDVAWRLRISDIEWKTAKAELEDAGLLEANEQGQIIPHKWDIWQCPSDISTGRVQRYRERKKQGETERNVSETFQETDVTLHGVSDETKRNGVDQNQTRPEVDIEPDQTRPRPERNGVSQGAPGGAVGSGRGFETYVSVLVAEGMQRRLVDAAIAEANAGSGPIKSPEKYLRAIVARLVGENPDWGKPEPKVWKRPPPGPMTPEAAAELDKLRASAEARAKREGEHSGVQ